MAKAVTVRGKEYKSMAAACRELGFEYNAVACRMSRGSSIEEAFEDNFISRGKPVTVRGVEYKSLSQACKSVGTTYRSMVMRTHRYGISLVELVELYDYQDGQCSVCEKVISLGNNETTVDHCHDSGEVRGLLCHGCNRLMDAVDNGLLEALLAYKANPPMENLS